MSRFYKLHEFQPFEHVHFAMIYMGLDEKDQAFEWLEMSYEERDTWIICLRSPIYDNLRSDPRFTALQNKMNLE